MVRLSCTSDGVCLDALLEHLGEQGVRSLMVEGGSEVIRSFLRRQRADHVILTVAPMFVGGKPVLGNLDLEGAGEETGFPRLENIQYQWMGRDLVLQGEPVWTETND